MAIVKFYIACVVFSLALTCGYAQQRAAIKVVDSEGASLAGVALQLELCGRKAQGLTDSQGLCSLAFLEGDTCRQIRVVVKSELYQPVDKVLDGRVEGLLIKLLPVEIGAARVKGYAQGVQEKGNATVYQVKAENYSPFAKADKVLSKLPGLEKEDKGVYRIEGNRRTAKIMVDGVEVSPEEVSHLDAQDIERVETKSVGMNDDSYDGEINIILRREKRLLLKGSTTLGASYAHPSCFGGSGDQVLQLRSRLMDIYADGRYIPNMQRAEQSMTRDGQRVYKRLNHLLAQQYGSTVRAGFFFTPKVKLALRYYLFGAKSRIQQDLYQGSSNTPRQGRVTDGVNWHYADAVFTYSPANHHTIAAKGQFADNTSEYDNLDATGIFARMRSYTGNVEYTMDSLRALWLTHSLGVGFKSIYRQSLFRSGRTINSSDVQQLYLTDDLAIMEGLYASLILRGEWDGYHFARRSIRHFNLLPTLALQYGGTFGTLTLQYRYSITRPSVAYLNPEIQYESAYEQRQGNAALTPEYGHELLLRYRKRIGTGSVVITASGTTHRDGIEAVYFSTYNLSTYENAIMSRDAKLNASYSLGLLNRSLFLRISGWGMWEEFTLMPEYRTSTLSLGNAGWSWGTRSSVSYSAPHDWEFEASCQYASRTLSVAQTAYSVPYVDLSIEKSFLQGKFSASLYLGSIIPTKDYTQYHLRGVRQEVRASHSSPRVSLDLTWRFGQQFRARDAGAVIENDDLKQ